MSTIDPVELIKEANWPYKLGRVNAFLVHHWPRFSAQLHVAVKWLGGPISDEELAFRKYFHYPSDDASLSHVKFTLEELATRFVAAMGDYRMRKEGYDASCRGAASSWLRLEIDHPECRRELTVLRRCAVLRYYRLKNAFHAARACKGSEIPEEVSSERVMPLSKLRLQLVKDLEEIQGLMEI